VSGIINQVAAAGAVLLKNRRRTLPITGIYFRRVAVAGRFAAQTADALRAIAPRIEWIHTDDTERAGLCDAVVLCLEADMSRRLDREQTGLFDSLAKLERPLITVAQGLGPVHMDDVDAGSDALLWIWGSGAFDGITPARLLMGQINPSGRLPITFPRGSETGLSYQTTRSQPLYPFGYGLSYSICKYTDMELSGNVLAPGEGVTASCKITNIGQTGGYETAQLYLRHDGPNLTETARWRLCRTERIYLQPGEVRAVSFMLPGKSFATASESGGKVLKDGRFILYMGGHQPDARSVWLTETPVLSAIVNLKGETVCF
jgi:beta-glucosidase